MRKRNLFNLSNEVKMTFDPGELIPINWWSVKPGDTFQASTAALMRSTKLLAPLMHTLVARIHWFYVPLRLVWDDAEDFFTGGEDGTSTPIHPVIQLGSASESSLYNYMGLPVATYGATLDVNALPFRCYSLIWNEFYRDQDLATARTLDTTSGVDSTTDVTIAKCAWPKDYFTSARPWEQKGTAVTIPLTGNAPVLGIGSQNQSYTTGPKTSYESDASTDSYAKYIKTDATDQVVIREDPDNAGYPGIYADLAAVTGVTIADLRENIALQSFMEQMARGGSRYSEYLRMLGIRSSDARLGNPEYLGGGKQAIAFSEVLATDGANTGDLKGHGIGAMQSNKYRKFFEEHGILMSMMSIIPKPLYMDGIPRKFNLSTKEDYHQSQLEHIGAQEVYNKELYAAHGTPNGVFGYQDRYDELRTENSRICGELNSTLNYWHMARDFGSTPALNETFIECTPTDRCWASTSTHKFIVSCYNTVAARRLLSRVGIPRIM